MARHLPPPASRLMPRVAAVLEDSPPPGFLLLRVTFCSVGQPFGQLGSATLSWLGSLLAS